MPYALILKTAMLMLLNFVGFALIAMANVGCDKTMSIVWLCVAVALCAATYSGFQVSAKRFQN